MTAARMTRDNVKFWHNDTNISPNIYSDCSVDTDNSFITQQADRVLAPLITTQTSKGTNNGDATPSASHFLLPSKSSILTESAPPANARTSQIAVTRRRRRASICKQTNQHLKSLVDFMITHNSEEVDLLQTAMTTFEVYFLYPFA